jgi:hypothetical protein
MKIATTLFLTIISTLAAGDLAAKSTPPPVTQGWPRERTNEQGRLIYYHDYKPGENKSASKIFKVTIDTKPSNLSEADKKTVEIAEDIAATIED